MKPLRQLLDVDAPSWPVVRSWIDDAPNRVEVLPPDPARRGSVLHSLQITVGSWMGAVAHETGGLLIDDGWIRILGGAGTTMGGTLANWNGFGDKPVLRAMPGMTIIGHDGAGGVFALDRGALGRGGNTTWYLCPDTLRWIPLQRSYSHFLQWLCTGDVAGFGQRLRWDGWADDLAQAGPDRAFTASPARWTAEGRHPRRQNLRPVSTSSLFLHQLDVAKHLPTASS